MSMLRRAENVHLSYSPLPFGRGWLVLHVGQEHFRVRRVEKSEFRGTTLRWSNQMPQRIAIVERYACWLYQGSYFWDDDRLNQRSVRNLIDGRLAAV
jgi:hypothetical protein